MNRVLVVAGALAAFGLAGSRAVAQVTVGSDVAVNSRYMFWGLTLSNKPVWQPDVYVTFAGFTAGVWGNFEFSKQSGPNDYTSGGNRSGNTEVDYWAEYNRTVGTVAAKLGVIRWTYSLKNTGSLSPYADQTNFPGLQNGPDINSTEIYGAVTLSSLPLSPNLTVYYDADIYKGFFGWVSVSKSVPIGPKSLTLGALAGGSTQESNLGSSEIPLFTKAGFTHFDFSASLPLTVGAISLSPNAHFQICNDLTTRLTSGTQLNGHTAFTFGVTASWSRMFGAKAAQ